MTTPQPEEAPPMLPTLRPGTAAHRLLQDSLTTLRDAAPDAETRQLYDDILSGRRSARELTSSPAFARTAMHGLTEYEERRQHLTPEQRHEEDVRAQAVASQAENEQNPQG